MRWFSTRPMRPFLTIGSMPIVAIDADYLSGERFAYQDDIPAVFEDEIARKVLVKHLQSGNSYGILLKEPHGKFPQPELGPWGGGSWTVGTDYQPSVLEGWESPDH